MRHWLRDNIAWFTGGISDDGAVCWFWLFEAVGGGRSNRTSTHLQLNQRCRAGFLTTISRSSMTVKILSNDRICCRHFIYRQPVALEDETNPDWLPSLKSNPDWLPSLKCWALEGVRDYIFREWLVLFGKDIVFYEGGTLPIDFLSKRTQEDIPLVDHIIHVCCALNNNYVWLFYTFWLAIFLSV